MKVELNIDPSALETKVLITAREQSRTVDALYEHITAFGKKGLETLTAYRDDMARIVNVADIFRIYTGNQKVYIQTPQGDQFGNCEREKNSGYRPTHNRKNLHSVCRWFPDLCLQEVYPENQKMLRNMR